MNDIFISYSRKDKEFVTRLATDLEREGWVVYYDKKLNPGQNFEDELPKQAASAKYLLVVLSPNSLLSDWVKDEVKDALEREKVGLTTVVPLLIKNSDLRRITALVGPKQYADFTNDYDTGFKETLSALGSKIITKGKPWRLKEIGIGALAVIGILALTFAYWQFMYKPAHTSQAESIQYAGRVVDADTLKAISGAKVSVETQGVPPIYYSDSEGIFYLKLPGSAGTARIRVEADGYKKLERNVSLLRTGIEQIPLEPVKNSPPANQNSSLGGGFKKPARNNKPDQINRILSSEPSNRPN